MTILAILLAAALAIPKTDATVGVAAIDLNSGKTVSVRGDEPFPLASVMKFPVALTTLYRVDNGPLRLDHKYTIDSRTLTLREIISAAVVESDNTAGDFLLRLVTPAAVNDRMKALRVDDIHIDRAEREIIETKSYADERHNTSTPLAMAALIGIFYRNHEGLSPKSHEFLLQLMTHSKNPVRIGRLLPNGSTVAHKTGTMPGIVNDAGLITSPDRGHHIAIAIFTKGAKKSSDAAREQVVAEVAKAVYERLMTR